MERVMTHSIFNAIDDNLPLNSELFTIDYHRDTDDGTFPTVNKWKRFCQRVDKDGDEAIFKFISGNRKAAKFDGFYIKRTNGMFGFDKDPNSYKNFYIIVVDNPIKVHFGEVGNESIIKEVRMIIGEIQYEFYIRKDGAQNEYCNDIEILFKPVKFM